MHRHLTVSSGLLAQAVVAAGLLAASAHPAFALVKCVDPEGQVTFQDVGCKAESTSHPMTRRYGQLSSEPPVSRTVQPRADTRAPGRQASVAGQGTAVNVVYVPATR